MKEDVSSAVPRISPLMEWLTNEQAKGIGARAVAEVDKLGTLSANERAYELAKAVSALKRGLFPKSGECCFVALKDGTLFTAKFSGYHEPTWALLFERLPFRATQDGPSLVLASEVKWLASLGEAVRPPEFEAALSGLFTKTQ